MNDNRHEIDTMETSAETDKPKGYQRVSTATKVEGKESRGDKSYYTYSIEHPERDIHKIFFPRNAKITDACICVEDMEASRAGIAIHVKVVGSNTMYPTTTIELREGMNKLPDFEVIPNTVIALEAMSDDHTKMKGFHISFTIRQ